ncbi:glycosyltransferase family A protein [Persephonella sp.]|uniref:glycosyltransferase family A protein n=1 Tax=Persephonella sp. TaxID=2060922 RepID=UPI002616096B|nr:glycosyltransferase family A protein [Persephonella sp.]
MKVLVGSPIRQKPEILKYFLEFLTYLEYFENLDFFFIDDNVEEASKNLLENFRNKTDRVILEKSWYGSNDEYKCDDITHHWTDNLIWKVADFKDRIIDYAREKNYDYLFFVDSDLLLYPQTIKHLISTGKDIISEVFWTKWKPTDSMEYPQVWLSDQYNLFEVKYVNAPEEIKSKKALKFIKKLKKKGIYKVGGLGACTLISKKALEKGVSFKPLYNLSLWGEDRHFCVRAVALGFELFASTYYPPLHLYRGEDLKKVNDFRRKVLEKKEGH